MSTSRVPSVPSPGSATRIALPRRSFRLLLYRHSFECRECRRVPCRVVRGALRFLSSSKRIPRDEAALDLLHKEVFDHCCDELILCRCLCVRIFRLLLELRAAKHNKDDEEDCHQQEKPS